MCELLGYINDSSSTIAIITMIISNEQFSSSEKKVQCTFSVDSSSEIVDLNILPTFFFPLFASLSPSVPSCG